MVPFNFDLELAPIGAPAPVGGAGAAGGGMSAAGGGMSAVGSGAAGIPGLPRTAGIAGATPTIVPFSFDRAAAAGPGATGAAGGGIGAATGTGADGGGTSAGGGTFAALGFPTIAGIAGATPTIVPFSFDREAALGPGATGAAGGGASGGEPPGGSRSVIFSPLFPQS
jgi:hypothetical protein